MVASVPQHAIAGLSNSSPGDSKCMVGELTSQSKGASESVKLHVKHTFFEIVDTAQQSQPELSNLRRTCSDSAVFQLAGACDSDDEQVSDYGDEEVVLLGFSDDDGSDCDQSSTESAPSEEERNCTVEEASEQNRSSLASLSTSASASRSTPPEMEGKDVVSFSATEADVLKRKLEEMADENARLSKENLSLRGQVQPCTAHPMPSQSEGPAVAVEAPVNAALAGPCLNQFAMSSQMQLRPPANGGPVGVVAPQCFAAYWVPAGMQIAPVACFAMPEMQRQPQAESPRKRKNRTNPSMAANGPDRSTGVILPNPTKDVPGPPPKGPRTTVMIRNMPNNYSREMLMDLLDSCGFAGQYGFLYLPMDFKSQACLGYAFVDCATTDVASRLWDTFDGFTNWAIPSRKASGVSWSAPLQGLRAHVERYRNSPVMAADVPDQFKPIVLENGVRVPFPQPTRELRATWQGRLGKTGEDKTQQQQQQ
jgi:hypothetical protein